MAIKIVDSPINSMVIFHGYVSHNQMVPWKISRQTPCLWKVVLGAHSATRPKGGFVFVVNCKRLKQTCSNKQTITHHTIIHTLESVEFMMMISQKTWRIQLCRGNFIHIPSGKRLHNYGKSSFLMGKSTISMAIFNSYVSHCQRVIHINGDSTTQTYGLN